MEIKLNKRDQELAERNSAILEMYCNLLNEYPDAKGWRLLDTIATKFEMSIENVRLILIKKGAYVTNKNFQNQES